MKQKFLTLILTFILFLLFAPPVLAQGPDGDQVIFGDNLVLQAEEKIDGSVVVFGGNVTMPASAEIDGDMVVFGGNAHIAGTVSGDIGMIGGNIDLAKTARIGGDIGLVGGRADVAEGAVVEGRVQSLTRFGFDRSEDEFEDEEDRPRPATPATPVAPAAPVPPKPPVPPFDHVRSADWDWMGALVGFVQHVVGNMILLVALAAIGWVVATFMPEQMKVVGDTVVEAAPFSFGVGLVTLALTPVVSLVLLITICLAFIPPLAAVLLGIAVLFGWIVIGQIIGERLLVASGQPFPSFVFATVVGVTVLTVVTKMPLISQIPCLGFLLGFLGWLLGVGVAATGLGAVILTRFGTQPYSPQPGAFRSGPPPTPAPATGRTEAELFSSLNRAEAELRAKIKAALAEADQAATSPAPEPETPPSPVDEEIETSPEPAAGEAPEAEPPTGDEKPGKKPKRPAKADS